MSPLMLVFAALPGAGLLLLVAAVVAGLGRADGGALWFLFAFMALFLGISTYAFGRAAWAKQVACQRDGAELEVRAYQLHTRVKAERARLRVVARRFGWNRPITVHLVVLEAPELARAAALRLSLHARRSCTRVCCLARHALRRCA